MLKIIYSETGSHLELLSVNRQEWIDLRIDFATSVGESMTVTQQRATFLLPSPMCDVTGLDLYLRSVGEKTVTLHQCDCDYVEIGLDGKWICTDIDSDEGIFIAQLADRTELCLLQLWHAATQELVS